MFVRENDGFVVAASPRKLVVWSIEERRMYSEVAFDEGSHQESSFLQSVAVNPVKAEVATADVTGRVFLWHSLFREPQPQPQPQPEASGPVRRQEKHQHQRTEVQQWHAHGVSCLAYTSDGNYLLSGGEEAVLVLCQLAKNEFSFLPRLGGQLMGLALSQEGQQCAVLTSTNALWMINPMHMRACWTVKRLTAPVRLPGLPDLTHQARIWAHPSRAGVVVSNCRGGFLQLYGTEIEAVLEEVEVVPANVVSRRDNEVIVPPCVTHFGVSSDGSRMATVEVQKGEDDIERSRLKFWDYNFRDHRFQLTSVVDRPHDGAIRALAYHPRADMVATCSEDGAFKLWAAEAGDEGDEGRSARVEWGCRATVGYRADKASASLAFSEDGSMLAVAAGAQVTLWETEQLRLAGTLSYGSGYGAVQAVRFLPGTARLVSMTPQVVVVWDLLTLRPVHEYRGEMLHLEAAGRQLPLQVGGSVAHFSVVMRPRGTRKAVSVVLFNAMAPEPLHTHQLPPDAQNVLALTMMELGRGAGGVLFLTPEGLHVLTSAAVHKVQRQRGAQQVKRALALGPALPVQPLKRVRFATEEEGRVTDTAGSAQAVTDIFAADTAHLPQPSVVFDSFLRALMPRAAQVTSLAEERSDPEIKGGEAQESDGEGPMARAPMDVAPPEQDKTSESIGEGAHSRDMPVCAIRNDLLGLLKTEMAKMSGATPKSGHKAKKRRSRL
jgi:hypothetical protein